MSAARVSVVIPTYGHAKFVAATLESVFAQTFSDYEVIVINDGSPDETANVLAPFIDSGRIRYVEQSNAGPAAARNRGILATSGEYVALLDDDDLWPTDKLQWQVAALDRDAHLGAIGGCVEFIDEGGERTHAPAPADDDVTFFSLFRGNPFWSPGQVLIRRELLRACGGFDTTLWGADDWQLLFALSRRGAIKRSSQLSLRYRVHRTNSSHDTVRMFENTHRVLARNLRLAATAERPRLQAIGYTTFYNYLGKRLLDELVVALRARDFPATTRLLRAFAPVFPRFVREPTLRRKLWRHSLRSLRLVRAATPS